MGIRSSDHAISLYNASVSIVECHAFRLIAGTLRCGPNAKNPRDLDISLDYSFSGKHMACHDSQEFRMR